VVTGQLLNSDGIKVTDTLSTASWCSLQWLMIKKEEQRNCLI